ncbi:MAG: FAD-dependent oxidoreductase [Rubrivivax sp.]|nr:FAD-dependent oxidoreductase [Rubrivivax sp.]
MQQILVIGGGVIGAATACFLARDHGLAPVVIERDPSYQRASSALSASSIRQQFSTAINIALSRASLDFYRRIGDELAVGDERPDIGLVEPGYLYLASAAGAPALRELHQLQRAHGVDVALLEPAALNARFPWLAVDDLALGSLGLSGEGWFDGWSVLQAFRRKAIACGARFINADAAALEVQGGRVQAVQCADGQRLAVDQLVLAAGAWSAALLAPLGVDLPVRARKRDVFVFDAPVQLPGAPLLIDPGGMWFRPEGGGRAGSGRYITGAPPRGVDADDASLDAIDHGLFDEFLWPALAARVPAFEALRVVSAWAGYYEMNTFDCNGLVGLLPGWDNLHLACGFSGHGLQQAPAVARGLAQQLASGRWGETDLAPLSPARIARGEPILEHCVI